VRSLRENLEPKPCRIDRAIARSIRQGWGLRFSRKDRTFEVNKLFIIWLFALVLRARNRPVGITYLLNPLHPLWDILQATTIPCGDYGRIMPYNWSIRARVISAINTSRAIARSILRFSRKDRTVEVNKKFISWPIKSSLNWLFPSSCPAPTWS